MVQAKDIIKKYGFTPSISPHSLESLERHFERIKDLVAEHYSAIDSEAAFDLYRPFLENCFELIKGYPSTTLPVFTTNYDLAIEKTVKHSAGNFRLIDGFNKELSPPEWSAVVYDSYEPPRRGNALVLFKLHGSVDWQQTPFGPIQRAETGRRDSGTLKTVVIYPTQRKSEQLSEEPYKTGFGYLSDCLCHANCCVVIGFSFRDAEIVRTFREGLKSNKNLMIIVIDPRSDSLARLLLKKLKVGRSSPEFHALSTEFSVGNSKEVSEFVKSIFEEFLVRQGLVQF